MKHARYKKGFTMFFAVLVSGLTLAIGIALYDLVTRQLSLSQTTAQSQYAFYMADTGAECALYWDYKCTQSSCICLNQDKDGNCVNGTAFATSTFSASSSFPPSSGIVCNGIDVAAIGTPPTPFMLPQSSTIVPPWTSWVWNTYPTSPPGKAPPNASPTAATTTFEITLPVGSDTRCAQVTVGKYFADTGSGMQQHTMIVSDGFSTCDQNSPLRVERELRVDD